MTNYKEREVLLSHRVTESPGDPWACVWAPFTGGGRSLAHSSAGTLSPILSTFLALGVIPLQWEHPRVPASRAKFCSGKELIHSLVV